jgi:serine/threonine protein phosphatase 1
MDTGAGWSGVLSMMNVDTKEVFTSDPVPDLYPGVVGRIKK